MTFQELGRDPVTGRQLYGMALSSLESNDVPSLVSCGHRHFVALLALDASHLSVDTLSRFLTVLLESGAVYVCAWGSDCERVHDITDEIEVGDNPPLTEREHVMTTWHENESLAEAVSFALDSAWPSEQFVPSCTALVVISCGPEAWEHEIMKQLQERVSSSTAGAASRTDRASGA